ncbi:hypothetical protein ONS95_010007 [Cadophora gregata]|uniref:uncharacterized protein n=1 Tax=Cadophora gregata TaxID=51156 RepID=UPI0026DBC02D|nr:uncharacterized protein ONS95_010007 [Cadophora gregata]KAK0121721.1 hypothetical protein ONS95_010007 [Cadophora gregata]
MEHTNSCFDSLSISRNDSREIAPSAPGPWSSLAHLLRTNRKQAVGEIATSAPGSLGTLKALPLELRWQIYEALLSTPHIIFITDKKKHQEDQGILRFLLLVNKTIRKEVQDLLAILPVSYKWCFSPNIKVSYVNLFNPEVTTFRIINTKIDYQLKRDWTAKSLWHMLLILFHCDLNGQLVLRHNPRTDHLIDRSEPSDDLLSIMLRSIFSDPSDYAPNFRRIPLDLSNDFNAEFDQNILVPTKEFVQVQCGRYELSTVAHTICLSSSDAG